jgi:hypothetical protein
MKHPDCQSSYAQGDGMHGSSMPLQFCRGESTCSEPRMINGVNVTCSAGISVSDSTVRGGSTLLPMPTSGVTVSDRNLMNGSAVLSCCNHDVDCSTEDVNCSFGTAPLLYSASDIDHKAADDDRCASCNILRTLGLGTQCATCSFTDVDVMQQTVDMSFEAGDAEHDDRVGRSLGDLLGMSAYEKMTRGQLLARLRAHSVFVEQNCTVEKMKDHFLHHVLTGSCVVSEGVSCREIAQFIHTDNKDKRKTAQLEVLKAIPPRASMRHLRRVFDMVGINYEQSMGASKLCRTLTTFIARVEGRVRGKFMTRVGRSWYLLKLKITPFVNFVRRHLMKS